MPTIFNTQEIDSSQRLAYWSEVICRTYLAVDCRPQADITLDGDLRVRTLAQLELSDVTSPPMEYRRSPVQLRQHHEEHFQLVLVTQGSGLIEQDDRQALLESGDVALYSAAQPSLVRYPQGSRSLVLKIPRPLLISRVSCPEQMLAITLKGATAMGSLIGNLVREAYTLEEDHLLANDARFANGMLDIISAAFESYGNSCFNPAKNSPLPRIKKYIQDNLSDPNLQPPAIASKHNVSIRTLNRLFAAEGTTAHRWIWMQRLASSHKSLSEGQVRQVSEAALNSGFNDLSHFSKAFKKTYGISPHELLRSSH